MTTVPVPQCAYCRHFNAERWLCPAFPEQSIPLAIITGEHDHRESYPEDHGIHFEPIDDEAAQSQAALFEAAS